MMRCAREGYVNQLHTPVGCVQGLEEAVKKMVPNDDAVPVEDDIEEGSRFFVRITDLPLQDKLRELRWGQRGGGMGRGYFDGR